MKFNIHGRFQLEVLRVDEKWAAYRVGNGIRVPERNVIIPATAAPEEIPAILDDIFHEFAGPDTTIRRMDES